MELLEYKYVKDDEITRRLIEAVVQLVNEQPIDSITTSDITNRANIGKQVFYSYFQTKQSLINYVYYDAVKDLDEIFSRYDKFAETSVKLKQVFSRYMDFLPRALSSKQDDSLSSFVSYYWIKFNQDLYKKGTGKKTVPAKTNKQIEDWVYNLVDEMSSPMKNNNQRAQEYHSSLQLTHAPREIRKILIMNSLNAGVSLNEMGLSPDELLN